MNMHFVYPGLFASSSSPNIQKRDGDEPYVIEQPIDSENGSFVFPREYPLAFREGSNINISWSTNYPSIHLYFFQGDNAPLSKLIASNLAIQWHQWEVSSPEKNLTEPFILRCVNAQGTEEEKTGGGFFSPSFYIYREGESSSINSSPSATSALSISALQDPASSSFPFTTPSSATTTVSSNLEQTSAVSSPAEGKGDGGLSTGAVAGLSSSMSIVAVIILIVVGLYLRRRHRRQAGQQTPIVYNPVLDVRAPPYEIQEKHVSQSGYEHRVVPDPVELPGPDSVELPAEK